VTPALELDAISKVYPLADEDFYALREVSFDVPIGEYVALMGPSGSGKSTLMNLIGLLDTPTELSVRENVEVPLTYAGYRPAVRRRRALEVLERVGLGDRVDHRPSQLSGGQRQRVAIARALAMNPSLLLADEPTGNLDSETGLEILALFDELHAQGATIVMVTHEPDVAERCERVLRLRDGRLESDSQGRAAPVAA